MSHRNRTDESTTRTDAKSEPLDMGTTQPRGAPGTDPTNPYNQEPTGDWVANQRAAERSNNEPGLTDHDRKQRRW
ncbi:MAG TPA: hypothetical protein VMG10_34620 [Gemmataceae bacterium]|nr:hypothetical protein [Gemmataceae bacterium]